MTDAFSYLHHVVSFTFFAFVITLSMFLNNPVCLALSLFCSLANALYLNGKRAVKLSLAFLLPMIILVAIINPVFNHQGVTILSYFPWGNPLTLESIIYGVVSALLLSTAVLWFSSFNRVMTSDKFVYLFGRIIPSLSLVLSMTLRFVPKFCEQFKRVRNAQKCIGRDISEGGFLRKIKNAVRITSIMITWAMENAIETADSMKSRGYGLKGRTAFSIYKFDKRDLYTLIAIVALGSFVSISAILGGVDFLYFPMIKGDLTSASAILTFCAYSALMLAPLGLNVKEELKWKQLRSKI